MKSAVTSSRTVLRRATPTLIVWIAVLLTLDLPRSMAVAGVMVGLLLAWWETKKEIAALALEHGDADDQDAPFEQTPPIFYV
jgi:hypothetical protein